MTVGTLRTAILEILENVKVCINKCFEVAESKHSVSLSQIKGIGIANQRETTVVWDRNTGKPLHNAIVWQDIRTKSTCDQLRSAADSNRVRRTTGLPISSYFSGVKLRWMIDNVPEVRDAVKTGTALFGTIDTWLVWNLSTGQAYVTDVTNAGRTMLMNLRSLEWDESMLRLVDIPKNMLPNISSSSEVVGHLSCTKLEGIPISGLIGDQQAALVGQSCFDIGEAKSTYGTGCFLIVNTGTEPKLSRNGLLTSPAYKLGEDAQCTYLLEGSIAVAGSAITWLRDELGIIDNAAETEAIAQSVPDTGGVYAVPAFTGLYAPWWREDARGTIVGMTQFTKRAHIVRAILEALTFKVDAVLRAASDDMGVPISQLKVDGGVTNNSLIMQMQADVTGVEVIRPKVTETTALGAAFCAGRAVGLFQSQQDFREAWKLDSKFKPQIDDVSRNQKLRMWNRAVHTSLSWAEESSMPTGESQNLPALESNPNISNTKSPDEASASPDLANSSSGWFDFCSRELWVGIVVGICSTYSAFRLAPQFFKK